jgi:hypothetical protein
MWDTLFNIPEALQKGADVTTYLILAGVGTILFLARLVIALFFGTDAGDFDADASADAGSDASFTLFSLLSIMAFIMGTGWMGLAARVDWGLGRAPSAVLAVGFGVLMMFIASGLMSLTRRLNRDVHYDLRTAVGRTARVYLTLPPKGGGEGQVEVSVSGRKKVVRAVNRSPEEIQAFSDVRVVEVRDDETLIVEKL